MNAELNALTGPLEKIDFSKYFLNNAKKLLTGIKRYDKLGLSACKDILKEKT